jgi:hypothetical protein
LIEASGWLHALAALTSGKELWFSLDRREVVLRAGLNTAEKRKICLLCQEFNLIS